ncbi:MAG TPA: rhombosortase [Steroidobacteraceae bacterium]|jgi:rhomboid family GlyGly-CTERM serine protease|nr:rhombosortase [Steroidobacteraceae bacterium]
MPRDTARRLADIAGALQWDRGRWIWLLLILLALDAVLGLGDNIDAVLRYDRSAIAAGGWWRLLTAHIVHLDLHHLILNELGLVLMWSLFADDYDAVEWCAIVLSGALAISSGLWWLSPGVAWYVGASGVLHSVMAAGTVKHLLNHSWDRWILSVGLCIKLLWEQWAERRGVSTAGIVVDAHLYGALCGAFTGGVLMAMTAIIRHRSAD